jgi:prevent-host-death family protein
MTSWPYQKAKIQFSELIRRSKTHGPQSITWDGHVEAIVLSKKDYVRLCKIGPNLVEFFKNSPIHGIKLQELDTVGLN